MSQVTNVHNELDRIKGYSPFQWTCAYSGAVWKGESQDSTDPATIVHSWENQLQPSCACRTVPIDESWGSDEVETENTPNFTSASLCTVGGFRRARTNLDRVGTETGLDQHEFMHTAELTDDSVELFGACTTRRCPEQHQSKSDQRQRQTRLHETNTHVPDGAWTDLLEQEGPPSEPVDQKARP